MEKKIRKIADALCEKINALDGWKAIYSIVDEDETLYTNFMLQHIDEGTGEETIVGDTMCGDLSMMGDDVEAFADSLDEIFDTYGEGGEYTEDQLQLISDLFDNIKFFL